MKKRPFVIAGALAAVALVPLLLVVIVWSGNRARALEAYVLLLGALLLFALVRLTAGPDRSGAETQDGEDRRSREPAQLPELARVEREVVLATARDFDLHLRIKPLLRDVAAHRLWSQRGVDLDESPDKARELLGPEAWDLLKPQPPAHEERFVGGIDLAGLRRVVDTIEEL